MQLPPDGDVAKHVIEAGGVDLYLQRVIHDSKSLRSVSALASLVAIQQKKLGESRNAGPDNFRAAADQALGDVRGLLADIEHAAADVLAEFNTRREKLDRYARAFEEHREATAEHAAIIKCRDIADAYHDTLRPLTLHQKLGDGAHLGGVAGSVERLVDAVQSVRVAMRDCTFGEDEETHSKLLQSLENRTVGAVIKARAAFVNILDNEFRAFGWPMKIPHPVINEELIRSINFFVTQLNELQRVSEKSDFIPDRTRWQRALSDSWAIASILRAPLARFKYHFLETFRADLNPEDESGAISTNTTRMATTSRFDRPEWAADFAVDRIQEATPFLREIAMDGPRTAEFKFVKGFCRVFADKIAYDCELAMRSSKNDSDADALISHAASIAKQFDVKLRAGALLDPNTMSSSGQPSPEFPSALSLLSENTGFFTAWASSELRLAGTQVSARLDKILSVDKAEVAIAAPSDVPNGTSDAFDVETECAELLQLVGESGSGCRELHTSSLVSSFLRLTELPLLQTVRDRLREVLDSCMWNPTKFSDMFQCSRAIWCAQVLAELLEDRIFEPFYSNFEKEHGFSLYAEEIERLKTFTERAVTSISEAVSDSFIAHVKESYQEQVRFGELASQDAAVVLAHDLSEPLCKSLTVLEESLQALSLGIANRKLASTIWRPVATRVDSFFFSEVIMQMFAGGTRNAVPAASPTNAYLAPRNAAKMARQVAFDASAIVSVFGNVSARPQNFLPACADAAPLLQMATRRVMRPNIALKQGHEEAFTAVCRLADEEHTQEDVERAREALSSIFSTATVSPRECLELFAIAGLQSTIPLS